MEEKIKEAVISTVEENADLDCKGTDPGIVFLKKAKVPSEIKAFSKNAITGIVTISDAKKLLSKFNGEAVGFKNGRGIIGGLAAVGETFHHDHTYEILAYRVPENYGLKRKVDETSILEMDKATSPYTFNNADVEKKRVIITPRGPDPILFGIRGEDPQILKKAFGMVKSLEPVERWVIFRTNQGTDAHLVRVEKLSQINPYTSVIVRGTVSSDPKLIRGRHVIFSFEDESGEVDCAAYEPTGALNRAARELIVGDCIEAYGSARQSSQNRLLTLNLEKLRLLKLAPKTVYCNPVCPKCNKRLKSMGRGKGFRCEKCGSKYRDAKKISVEVKREIEKGLYITSTRSQRHLTKPLKRYGLEKRQRQTEPLIDCWHFP
jgi:tRNA(Ile2)-agmatinylcytidine synthase